MEKSINIESTCTNFAVRENNFVGRTLRWIKRQGARESRNEMDREAAAGAS